MPARAGVQSLVVKVAERCNLNCSYCYIYNHFDRSFLQRPAVMDDATFTATVRRMREYCDRHAPWELAFTFHGGEPTLLGATRLGRYAAQAREILGPRLAGMAIQTNATRIDAEWVRTFRRHGIQVGVSLDGPPHVHDRVRVTHDGHGSYAATVAGLRRLQDAGLNPGVLTVVNPGADGLEIYEHLRDLDVRWIGFLLPDVSHDSRPLRYPGTGATPVADYLIPVFDRWFDADDPEVVVRLFWELLRLLAGGTAQTDAFGGPLTYLVIETDGAIQPVDTLRVCGDGLIETRLNVATHGFDDLAVGAPLLHRLVHGGVPLSATCARCPEQRVCGGGYIAHRYSRARQFDNPSVWCADLLALIAHIRRRVSDRCPTFPLPSSSSPTVSATAS